MIPRGANVAAHIVARLSDAGDKPFLTDDRSSLTRRQFLAAVNGRAVQLAAFRPQSAVLIVAGRGIGYWIDMVAVWGAGLVGVPIGIGVDDDVARVMAGITKPCAILCNTDENRPALDMAPRLNRPAPREGMPPVKDMTGTDLASIIFTSGSTGMPKGVALPHRSLLGNARASLAAIGATAEDRLFFAIPFNFISAVSHFCVMALAGAEMSATEDRLAMGNLGQALNASGATCFGGSPLQLRWIAECAPSTGVDLRWAMSSGDHLSVKTIELFRRNLPRTALLTVYGLTELGGRFCLLPADSVGAHAGSVGKPIRGASVVVLDEDGRALPAGEIGEIYAGGEYLLREYFGNPNATARALTAHGFRTGDLGYLDAGGFLYVCGRADDVFKCHGAKVSAVPIIDAVMETGLFEDAAIIGWDDPNLGTVPRLLYVPKPGATIDHAALARGLRGKLPATHIPRAFTVVSAIPRTGSGKIKRLDLRRLAETG